MPNVINISLATSASTWVWLPELLVSSAIEYLIEQLWVQRVLESVTAWELHVLLERVRISAIPNDTMTASIRALTWSTLGANAWAHYLLLLHWYLPP